MHRILMVLVAALLCGAPVLVAPPAEAGGKLPWPPPNLTNPDVIDLDNPPGGSTDADGNVNYNCGGDDLRVRFPDQPSEEIYEGALEFQNCDDIIIKGGHNTIHHSTTSSDPDYLRRGLYFKNVTGKIHVEGWEFSRCARCVASDAIGADAPGAILQLQNVRITGIQGEPGAPPNWHGDAIQPFGGLDTLRLYKVTIESDYQGIYLVPDGSSDQPELTYLKKVDFEADGQDRRPESALFWASNDGDVPHPVVFGDETVYLDPRSGHSCADEVRPNDGITVSGGLITWTDPAYEQSIPHPLVCGSHSDFVGTNDAGLRYAPPGYQ